MFAWSGSSGVWKTENGGWGRKRGPGEPTYRHFGSPPHPVLDPFRNRLPKCTENKHLRGTYWADTVDLIIDNRKFEIPTYERARKYLKAQRVRCRYGVRPAFARSVRGG